MALEYRIPFQFKAGQYNSLELQNVSGEYITLKLGEWDVLTYTVPKSSRESRLYSVNEQSMKNDLYATYNDEGMLKYVEIISGDDTRLIFINYLSNEDARAEIMDFAEQSADIISGELLKYKGKAARLFIEYYRAVEGFDFAAKIGSDMEKQMLIDSLPPHKRTPEYERMIADNCGDYPHENRIECDSYTLGVMLDCCPNEICGELLDMAITYMTNAIRDRVTDKLDKTDDFRFIAAEYD